MLCDYSDITGKLGTPLWWDEHGVPRYCDFHPMQVANIYAKQVALVAIECQHCNRTFCVAISSDKIEFPGPIGITPVKKLIEEGTSAWGDPPNIGCCPAGPTMTSNDLHVMQYWEQIDHEWTRDNKLEIPLR